MTSPPPANSPQGITKERALEIARRIVERLSDVHDFVVLEDKTVERPFGWVFTYVPRRYLQTKNPNDLVPGAAPLVVHRADGSTIHLATSVPPARAIEIYEQRWNEAQTKPKPGP